MAEMASSVTSSLDHFARPVVEERRQRPRVPRGSMVLPGDTNVPSRSCFVAMRRRVIVLSICEVGTEPELVELVEPGCTTQRRPHR